MAKRRSAAEWEQLVGEWRRSGLSAREFAESAGVAQTSLSWWAWNLGSKAPKPRPAAAPGRQEEPLSFLPVRVLEQVAEPATDTPIELEVGGFRIQLRRGFDPVALRELLEVLEGASC